MTLENGETTQPCRVILEGETTCRIVLREGKYHQVKRMCEQLGKKVVYLKRLAIGNLQLDETLACGQIRELTAAELALFNWQ